MPFLGPRVLNDFNSRGSWEEREREKKPQRHEANSPEYGSRQLNAVGGGVMPQPTSVSAQVIRLKVRNRRAKAIFISSWATLIPTQFRGPAPNGRYTKGCRAALASGVNLD